jgi:hypothetical protein
MLKGAPLIVVVFSRIAPGAPVASLTWEATMTYHGDS